MMIRITAFLLGLILASGCRSFDASKYSRDDSFHIIAANGQGHPVDPMTCKTQRKETFTQHVDDSLDRMLAAPQNTVVIYIHGGMVPLDKAIERAYINAPLMKNDGIYPMFFNWHSELFDSYFDHLLFIRNGERMSIRGPLTMPIIALADVGRGICRFPITWYTQFQNDWNTTPFQQDEVVHDALDFEGELIKRYQQDPQASIALNQGNHDLPMGKASAAFASYVVTLPFKYVISAPILEMVGTSAWGNMMRRTSLVFDQHEDFQLRKTKISDPAYRLDNAQSGPFGIWFSELHKRLDTSSADDGVQTARLGKKKRIILIAHSMGTIVANQILEQYADVEIDRIVYMAAACSVRDGYGAVLPYLDRHPKTKFYNLCLNWKAEKRERNAFDLPIRGSLLEWLDGIFVKPDTVLDHRMGKWVTTMRTAGQVPERLRSRVTFKTFDVIARDEAHGKMNPVKHGEFSTGEFWKPAYWKVDPNR